MPKKQLIPRLWSIHFFGQDQQQQFPEMPHIFFVRIALLRRLIKTCGENVQKGHMFRTDAFDYSIH